MGSEDALGCKPGTCLYSAHYPLLIPFCWPCIDHMRGHGDLKPDCCTISEAVQYTGFSGTIHSFQFRSWKYANLFVGMNRKKCLV